jgi:hypothetical protein
MPPLNGPANDQDYLTYNISYFKYQCLDQDNLVQLLGPFQQENF